MARSAPRLLALLILLSINAHAQIVWEQVGVELPAANIIDVAVGERDKVYALAASFDGSRQLYRSLDNARTWSLIDGHFEGRLVRVSAVGLLYSNRTRQVQGPDGSIAVDDLISSSDDGATWTTVHEGPNTPTSGSVLVDVAFSFGGRINVLWNTSSGIAGRGLLAAARLDSVGWEYWPLAGRPTMLAALARHYWVAVAAVESNDTGLHNGWLGVNDRDSIFILRDSVLVTDVDLTLPGAMFAAVTELGQGDRPGTTVPVWTGISLETDSGSWSRAAEVEVSQFARAKDGSQFAIGRQGAFRSIDHAATWRRADTGLPYAVDVSGDTTFGLNAITAPDDGTVLVATNAGLYRARVLPDSSPAPSTRAWRRVRGAYATTRIGVLDATNDGRLVARTGPTAAASTDRGITWTPINLDAMRLLGAAPTGELFAMKSNSGVPSTRQDLYRSTDWGESWSMALASPVNRAEEGSFAGSIWFESDGNVYASYSYSYSSMIEPLHGSIHRSTDRGATWRTLAARGPVTALAAGTPVYFGTHNTNIGDYTLSRLWRLDADSALVVRDSFLAVGAVRTMSGALLVSGGVQRIRTGSGYGQWPLYYSDAGIYRLAGIGEELELTHAGLWVRRFHVAADGSILASGAGDVRNNDPQTWRSTDDGRTWERYDRGIPYTGVEKHTSLGDTLFAATAGGLYHVGPDFSPTSGITTAAVRERHELMIRPNPATGSTTITFELARPSECRLEIFDLRGELVGELARRRLPAGNHDVDVAMGDLPAGIYHVRLIAGDLIASRSILVQ